MAATQFVADIPQRLLITVLVPQHLSTRNVDQTVQMFASRLRFLLAQAMRQQVHNRAVARGAARDAKRAALAAAAERAVAEEAAAEADRLASDGRRQRHD